MTLRMIQPIGKRPIIAPSRAARSAMPVGMVKTAMVTRIATSERDDGGDMDLDAAGGDQPEQEDDRNGGGKRGQCRVVERIIDLIPHIRILPGLLLGPGRVDGSACLANAEVLF